MGHNLELTFEAAWKILIIGIVLGAGLPVLFAAGIRSLAFGQGGDAEVSAAPPHPVGRVLAGICFLIVLAAVVLGITYIVATGFGKAMSFDHIYPTIHDK